MVELQHVPREDVGEVFAPDDQVLGAESSSVHVPATSRGLKEKRNPPGSYSLKLLRGDRASMDPSPSPPAPLKSSILTTSAITNGLYKLGEIQI